MIFFRFENINRRNNLPNVLNFVLSIFWCFLKFSGKFVMYLDIKEALWIAFNLAKCSRRSSGRNMVIKRFFRTFWLTSKFWKLKESKLWNLLRGESKQACFFTQEITWRVIKSVDLVLVFHQRTCADSVTSSMLTWKITFITLNNCSEQEIILESAMHKLYCP